MTQNETPIKSVKEENEESVENSEYEESVENSDYEESEESSEEESVESCEEEKNDMTEISPWETKYRTLKEKKKYEIIHSVKVKNNIRKVLISMDTERGCLGLYLPKRYNVLSKSQVKNLKNFYISHDVPDGKINWIDVIDNAVTFYF
jgi:ATP-dependent Lon protease